MSRRSRSSSTGSRRCTSRRPAWTSPITSKLLLEVRYANRGEAFGNQPDLSGDIWNTMIPVLEQSTNFQYRGRGGDGGVSGTFGFTRSEHQHGRDDVSYVTGAHAFKVGFSDTWADTKSSTDLERLATCTTGSTTACRTSSRMYGTPTQGESAGERRDRPVRAGSLDASSA